MPLPQFKDKVTFSGQTKWWGVIHGQVWKGVVERRASCPYLAHFGWHARTLRYCWGKSGPSTTPWNFWVTEGYSTKKAALAAQRKIKCECGERWKLRFVCGYSFHKAPQNPIAVGVWCDSCWETVLKNHSGVESKAKAARLNR